MLVSLHQEELLILGSQKFFGFLIERIFGGRSRDMEGRLVKISPRIILVDLYTEQRVHLVVIEVVFLFMVDQGGVKPFVWYLVLIPSVQLKSHSAVVRRH